MIWFFILIIALLFKTTFIEFLTVTFSLFKALVETITESIKAK